MIIAKKCRVETSQGGAVTKYSDTSIENYHHKNTVKPLKFTAGSFYLPKDNEKKPGGEDAHFILEGKNTIGLADGVGGWAKKGVDSGKYSRELMAQSVAGLMYETKGSVDPKRIMQYAHTRTRSKGSSTVCIITLDRDNFLHYANLGDSGFMVFRDKKLLYQSQVQQHGFNCPYQLGNSSSDTPNLAYEDRFKVEDGDIVVAGTDGLLDNMFPSEISEIFEMNQNEEVYELAWLIAEFALLNAVDDEYESPFGLAAAMAGKLHEGGKYDDITVIVAKILPDLV